MKRLALTMIAVVWCMSRAVADGNAQITSVEYWIDNDQASVTTSTTLDFVVNCASLHEGMHTLHYRVADSEGRYSALQEHGFYKMPAILTAEKIDYLQYWLDDKLENAVTIPYTPDQFVVSANSLPTGMHTLHYRVADSEGRYSALQEHGFYKLPSDKSSEKIDSLQYWWDDMHQNAVTAPYSPDQFVLSTNALPYGLHSLKYRVKDDIGRWSDLHSHYFYNAGAADTAKIVSYTYWWNDLEDKAVTTTLSTPAAIFTIDEGMSVPEEARTSYAGHYTATLTITFTDNRGRMTYVSANVAYPDNEAPVTDIDADNYVASTSVKLTWTEKTNDEMGDYNIYYSKDNGPFVLWLADTKDTSATFKGERGSMYIFTVTGRDASGNREEYDETKCVSVTFE